jgi:hypothetical protein
MLKSLTLLMELTSGLRGAGDPDERARVRGASDDADDYFGG